MESAFLRSLWIKVLAQPPRPGTHCLLRSLARILFRKPTAHPVSLPLQVENQDYKNLSSISTIT
jgi:hypothetical protein